MMTETAKVQLLALILRDLPTLVGPYLVLVEGEEKPFVHDFTGNGGHLTHCTLNRATLTFEVGNEPIGDLPSGTEFRVKISRYC